MKSNIEIAQLLKNGVAGDRAAIKAIYDDCVIEMLSASERILNSIQDAEDVFHESFLKSIEKIDTLDNWKSYKSWLKRIIINNSLQKIRNEIKWDDVDKVDIAIDEEENWYEGVSFENINDSIYQLPNGCRQILTLFLLEDYKHREIADILNISISTSKSQYRYALQLLKKIITENYLK